MTGYSQLAPSAAQPAGSTQHPSHPASDTIAFRQAAPALTAAHAMGPVPHEPGVLEAAAYADAAGHTAAYQPTAGSPTAGAANAADSDASREPRDSSQDGEEPSGGEDVDAWLHDVLQRVQPGCEITVNALHMLGELFETVRMVTGSQSNLIPQSKAYWQLCQHRHSRITDSRGDAM